MLIPVEVVTNAQMDLSITENQMKYKTEVK